MKRGFTLIELILVISILTIIMTIAVKKSDIIENYKAINDIKTIYRDIKYARNLAISNKSISTVEFYGENTYKITCNSIETRYYSKKIKLKESNLKEIGFTKRGSTTKGGSGTLVFQIKDKEYTITIEPVTGKVNLKK